MRRNAKHEALLAALATGVAQVDIDVALDNLPSPRIRRRVAQDLEAELAALAGDPAMDSVSRTVCALQRVYLSAEGTPIAPGADAQELGRVYYEARDASRARAREREAATAARASGRSGGRSRLIVVGLVALGLAGGLWLFVQGGTPDDITKTPVGQAFAERLPDWVVALDRWAPAATRDDLRAATLRRELDGRRLRLFDDQTRAALGEAIAPFEGVLTASETLAITGDYDGEPFDSRETAFRQALRDLNSALAAERLPYFVDGDYLGHGRGYLQTVLISFHVTDRVKVQASTGEVVEALHLRRIDSLNWVQGLLGYTRESMDVAVVLTDKVEHELVTFVGPTLANAAPMPLFQPDAGGVAWRVAVEAEAGRVAREAFATALPDRLEALRRFGAALEKRRDLFERWSERLAKKGQRLAVPGTLALPTATYASLKASLPDFQVETLEAVQGQVESTDNEAIFQTMHDIHLRSVEKHEVQHRLDYARGESFTAPPVLREALGEPESPDEAALAKRRLRHAAFELSAYLSEIARDSAWSKLSLTLLARHVLDPSGRTAEWFAAHLVLDALAERLGVSARSRVDGRVIPRRAAEVYLALMDADENVLAKAAQDQWRAWFGAPLPTLERITSTEQE